MTEYGEVAAYELSSVDASGAGEDKLVLVSDGTVVHVGGRGRRTLDVSGEPIDVAVGDLVYVLTAESLVALSSAGSGSRVWDVDLDGDSVEAVDVIPDSDMVCVLTASALLGIDRNRGSRRWSIERPYADIDDDGGLATGSECVFHDTWTFVTGFDASGEEVLDVTLDSAVVDVGWTDDVVVAALKTGKLLGVEVDAGTVRWEAEIRGHSVRSGGRNGVLVRTDDGVLLMSEDGSYESVDGLSPGAVFPARNGDLVCVHHEGTLTVYRRQLPTDCVYGTVETSIITPDGELRVRVGSDVDHAASVPLEVAVDGATLETTERTVDVEGKEETVAVFDVESVGRVDEATVVVTTNGANVVETTIEVDRPEPAPDAIACNLTIDRVEGSTVRGTLTIENEGGATPHLRVLEDDTDVGTVAPGERTSVAVNAPYVPENGVERTVTDGVGETVATVSAEANDGRTAVSLDQSTEDGFLFVDVTVSNGTDVTVTDELVVFGLGALDSVERDLQCPPGATWTLSVAIPAVVATTLDGNTVRVQLDGTAATDSLELALDDDFAESQSATDALTDAALASGDPGPSVDVDRSFTPETVERTERVEEYLSVHSDERIDDLTLLDDDATFSLGSIPAGIERHYKRSHMLDVTDRYRFERVNVTAGGDVVAEADTADVNVVDGPLTVRTRVEVGPSKLHVDGLIENRSGDSIGLVGVEVEAVGAWDLELGNALAPGEVIEWSGDVATSESEVSSNALALETLVEYGNPSDPTVFRSLAAVERVDDDSLADRLDVRIGDDTHVRDEYSTVVLEATNVSETVESVVEMHAFGDAVNDVVYVPDGFDEIAPGETVVHTIDVKPESDHLSLEVELDCGSNTERLELAGPVAPRNQEWTRDEYDAWSATWLTAGSNDSISYPTHLVTAYEETR